MPDLIYNVKFQIDDSQFQSETAGVERYKQEIQEAQAEIAELKSQLDSASNSSRKFSGTAKNVQGSTQRMNASFSSANQALFSFSDLTQDAAQFQQGFGVGMRAIGNNVGFTAELMGNLNTRVEQHNQALIQQVRARRMSIEAARAQVKTVRGELIRSLTGAGGLLIAINAAVLVVTVLSQAFDKNKKAAESAAGGIDGVSSAIDQLAKKGSLEESIIGNLEKSEADLEFLISKITEIEKKASFESIKVMEGQSKAQKALEEAREAQLQILLKEAEAVGIEVDGLKDAEKALEGVRATKKFLTEETETLEVKLGILADTIESRVNRSLLRFELGIDGTREPLEQELALIDMRISGLRLLSETTEEYLPLLRELTQLREKLAKILGEGDALEAFKKEEEAIRTRLELERLQQQQLEEARGSGAERILAGIREREEAIRQSIIELRSKQHDYQPFSEVDAREQASIEFFSEQRLRIARRENNERMLLDERFEKRRKELRAQGLGEGAEMAALDAEQDKAIKDLKIRNQTDIAQSIAQSAGALANVFGASKEIQIAMAVIDSGAAIVKTFSQLGFPAGIPAALAVAAQTAATIKQMQQVQPGSAQPIGAGSTSGASTPSFGFQMSQVEGPQTFRTPGYTPMARSEAGVASTVVQVLASRKQLYALTKKGEEEYRNIKAT